MMIGRMVYCSQTDQWEIHDAYDKPVPLYCGESFKIRVGNDYLHCRIEKDRDWMIYFSTTRFYLHPAVS